MWFSFALFSFPLTQGDSDDAGSIQDNLATLSSEISIKQKLVEQLEGAQKNMHSMRQQYESKLLTLQQQISRTESERDRVLKELGERGVWEGGREGMRGRGCCRLGEGRREGGDCAAVVGGRGNVGEREEEERGCYRSWERGGGCCKSWGREEGERVLQELGEGGRVLQELGEGRVLHGVVREEGGGGRMLQVG